MYKELLPKYAEVAAFVQQYQPHSVIDWGCAQGNLLARLQEDFAFVRSVAGYDPGNPVYATVPNGVYDCLISCDVVEHFEPHHLARNLKLMQSKFTHTAYIIAACYPAKKYLADGRNAHLIVENCAWWLQKIQTEFDQCEIAYWQAVDYASKQGPRPELRVVLTKL